MSDPPQSDDAVESLSPDALADRLAGGESVRLLDVRDRDEFDAWRVDAPSAETTLIPYSKWLQAEVRDSVADLAADVEGEGPVTVVCGRGEASADVADILRDAGIEARNLEGGMRGWAAVYRARDVPCEVAAVTQYRRPASGCLSYLIVSGSEAAVIDPLRAFTDRYVSDAADADAEITTVVDTHVHADHVSGLRDLAGATGATPVMSRPSVERGVTDDVTEVTDGESLSVGDAALRAVHLPGHTTGMTGFAVGDLLLSGDSLFLERVARPDLEQGEDGASALAARLYESLTARLSEFPDGTVVAPGHYSAAATSADDETYTAALGTLRERLPVFSMDREEFVARLSEDVPPRPDNFERIVEANLGREDLSEEEAFEVELGPNNCAATPSLGE